MRNFIGALIILFGVSVLLQTTGFINDPVVKDSIGSGFIMVAGIVLYIWRRREWVWATIIFLVGLTDLVENQQWKIFEQHTPWEFVWPIILVLIGFQILLKGKRPTNQSSQSGSK